METGNVILFYSTTFMQQLHLTHVTFLFYFIYLFMFFFSFFFFLSKQNSRVSGEPQL